MVKQITINNKEINLIEAIRDTLPTGSYAYEHLNNMVKRWDRARAQKSFRKGGYNKNLKK